MLLCVATASKKSIRNRIQLILMCLLRELTYVGMRGINFENSRVNTMLMVKQAMKFGTVSATNDAN